MPLTQVQSGMMDSTAQYYSFKNRLINGNMAINQRAVTSVAGGSEVYTLDRWVVANYFLSGAISVAQSSDAPAGFTNSLLVTNGTGEALSAGDFGCVRQKIEGFNIADFAWGTASASPITISFWVKSSVTGNYSVGLINGSLNRANRSVITINAANTWEQKSLTFTGDTSGTWTTNSGVGLYVDVLMVAGSNQYAAANTWTSNTLEGVSGASATWVTSTGATFYITGVQLEKGSTATSFDYRPYGTELLLCQRYYQELGYLSLLHARTTATLEASVMWPVWMRSAPSFTNLQVWVFYDAFGNGFTQSSATGGYAVSGANTKGGFIYMDSLTGLTQGRTYVTSAGSTGRIGLSAEL